MQKPEQVMQDFANLLDKCIDAINFKDRNDPEAWSQIYKVINYKPTQNIPKGQSLDPEKIREFLRLGKPGAQDFDPYDDMIYFDDNKVKEIVLRQNFLIAKGLYVFLQQGYFDPKAYFPSINLSSLDDTSFDEKIKEMLKIPDQMEKKN
ncbi:unnamed protein product (macronuclear) [Paramecium tetraurelia]|uniref:Uncharacterized protein n=1 Tax=Paramecium tetraurelia TaxID=5888 RepID=A0BW88_PARTE|nr:uncharacterized protein GSPATT00032657001 [Paramecium tetraurelia]CAK62805.1 unnamed protein product [Paramecium tetraurelia]|eukprot:XP_001430203.1 hypothetical protein (macronuclear) [Paramecium tetraurelia strain d4-2]